MTSEPTTATARLRAAMEAGDADGAVEALSPDVVLRSPITLGVEFHGREELRDLLEDVLATVRDVRYTEEIGEGDERVLVAEARVGRQRLHETVLLRLGADGLVSELTLFIRPLPGLAAFAAALGPRVASRHGRARAVAVAAMLRPLATALRLGERTGVRLVTPGRGPGARA